MSVFVKVSPLFRLLLLTERKIKRYNVNIKSGGSVPFPRAAGTPPERKVSIEAMNHTMKQLLSLVLALAMSVSLCVTVFAEGVQDLEPAQQENSEIVEEILMDEVAAYDGQPVVLSETAELYFDSTSVSPSDLKSALNQSSLTTVRITGAGHENGTTLAFSAVELVDGETYKAEKFSVKDGWSEIATFVFKVRAEESADATITLEDAAVDLPYDEKGELALDDVRDLDVLRSVLFALVYKSSTPELTVEDVTIEYSALGLIYTKLDSEDSMNTLLNLLNQLDNLNTLHVKISFAGNDSYKEASATAKITLTDARETAAIQLKDTVEVTLTYAGEHVDYEALKRQIFEKALETSTPAGLTYEDVEFTYSLLESSTLLDIPFEGATILGKSYASIDTDFGVTDSRTVKVAFPGNSQYKPCTASVKITMPQDTREQSTLVLKEGVSISFSSVEAMEKALFDSLIDWDKSTLPKKSAVTAESFTFEYASKDVVNVLDKVIGENEQVKNIIASLIPDNYLPLEGTVVDLSALGLGYVNLPRMGAGSHEIRVKFNGNDDFKPSEAVTAQVTVNKGKLTLKVNSASIIYSNPVQIPANLIETSDKQADVIVVYAGATSDIALAFYVDTPETMLESSGVLEKVEKVLENVNIDGVQELVNKLKNVKEDGITIGELREITKNDVLLDVLDFFGYDTAFLRNLVNFFDGISSVTDSVRIGFTTPNRAGLYTVTAISADSNYEAAQAVGTLLIRMNTSGNKLAWKSGMSGKQLTVTQAKTFDFGAKVTNGGVTVPESSIKYLYTGLTKKFRLYSSSKAPTEAGSYVVTAYVLGGNYLAAPITRTFKIVAD